MSAPEADPRRRLRDWLVSGDPPVPSDLADARRLVDAARAQRLIALLHVAIASPRAGEAPRWPDEIVDALADEHRRLLARGVGQLDLVARVTALLSAQGLRVLPLKGAAVAESLYGSVAERPMGDVDVLVLDDWRRSVRVLEDAGFAGAEEADHAWSFVDPLTGGLVEIHHAVTSCPDVFPLAAEEVWARAEAATGQVARVPAPEDLLLQLAAHALFQHGGVLSLGQWLDFRRLAERRAVDPQRLARAAATSGASACVRLAVEVARAVVGGPDVLADAAAEAPPRRRRWLEAVRRDPLLAVAPSRPSLLRRRWEMAAGRRWSLLRGTLAPTPPGAARRTSASAVVRRAATLAWRWGGSAFRP